MESLIILATILWTAALAAMQVAIYAKKVVK